MYKTYRHYDASSGTVKESLRWEEDEEQQTVAILVCPDFSDKAKTQKPFQAFFFRGGIKAAKEFQALIRKDCPWFSCVVSQFSEKGLAEFTSQIQHPTARINTLSDGDAALENFHKGSSSIEDLIAGWAPKITFEIKDNDGGRK